MPPLPCKKTKYREGKKVIGKITTKEEIEAELEISKQIEKIPNYSSYFIIQQLDNCTTTNFATMRPTYASDCPQYEKKDDSKLYQLLSPFGGIDLGKFVLTPSFQFKEALQHMLEAVGLMIQHNVCHTDLHSNNIVKDVRGKLRIIDFGMAFPGDEVSYKYVKEYVSDTHYSPTYNQIPPEFTVLLALFDGIPLETAIHECIHGKPTITNAQNLLGMGMSLEEQKASLREFFKSPGVYAMATQHPHEFFKMFWRKMDIWGIGGVFVKILKKCFLSPEFIETQWKRDGMKIRTVLKGIMQANPNLRLSPEEALQKLR